MNLINIKKYLTKTNKEYHRKKFHNYRDVEKLVEKDGYVKEVRRCQFLLKTIEELEKMIDKSLSTQDPKKSQDKVRGKCGSEKDGA